MRVLGILLIALGVIGLVWGGINYTKREKVIDIGPIEASVDKEKQIPVPPVAGALALVAGVLLVAVPRRSRTA